MTQYIALLRGINVGWNKKVEMSRLKALFESLGYTDVWTYINSGNVIFTSENDDFSKVEKALRETFWFEVPTIFRSKENITHLANKIPKEWKNDEEQKTDILFLWEEYDSESSLSLIKSNPKVDNLLYLPWAIVWNIERRNYSKSGMKEFTKAELYKNMTARNINTVRKLKEIMENVSKTN